MRLAWFVFLAPWLLSATKPAPSRPAATPPPHVEFSPAGSVKNVSQVVARFPAPMIGFGDPNPKQQPFTISCAGAGTGRWLEPRVWVYDFVQPLPGGVRCTFTLDAAVTALDGTPVPGPRLFQFDTGAPAVQWGLPSDGDTISEDQTFVIGLDAQPVEGSLSTLTFAIDGVAERIGVDVVGGEERAQVLREQQPHAKDDQALLVLRARRRFPNDVKVRLLFGAGLASQEGLATVKEQVLEWTVRSPFRVSYACQRLTKEGACLPITDLSVRFTAPIARARAAEVVLIAPDGSRLAGVADDDDPAVVERVTFAPPFTEASTYQLSIPANLTDEEARPLANADRFPEPVKIAPFPPLARFAARFGLLEAKADPALPLTVRRLEPSVVARWRPVAGAPPVTAQQWRVDGYDPREMVAWLRRVAGAGREHSIFMPPKDAAPKGKPKSGPSKPAAPTPLTIPTASSGTTMEVIGVPLINPGLHLLELESPRLGAALLGKAKPMYVPAAALVTNLAVHFKRGREGSVVWVTTLDSGQVVPHAMITLTSCMGDPLWAGETDADGLVRLGTLPVFGDNGGNCPLDDYPDDASYDVNEDPALRAITSGWFVFARLGDDVSFVHSDWNDGIEPWRFNLSDDLDPAPLAGHTVFDRTLLRAGETVHMKHVLRSRTLSGLAVPSAAERPTKVEIRHEGTDETWELPLLWDGQGSAESTWPVPASAKLGVYAIRLVGTDYTHTIDTGSFRVEEFRLPLLRATLKPPAATQVAATAVTIDAQIQYLAGGAAGNLPVVLRGLLEPRYVDAPDDYESYRFGAGRVREGVDKDNEEDGEEESDTPPDATDTRKVHQKLNAVLDATGAARLQITDIPADEAPRDLRAELEYRDPSGEVHTAVTNVPLWPAAVVVGVKVGESEGKEPTVETDVAVIRPDGTPVAGVPVQVTAFREVYYTSRKRVVGGVYSYEHVTERRKLGPFCTGTSDANGIVHCSAPPPARGQLLMEATATDSDGRATASYDSVDVSGDPDQTFRVGDTDRIDLIPDKRQYEPGETAHLQVRSPFRAATALVTVEREGVRTASVVQLAAEAPTVDVPITMADAPNVFVSVLAVRGRVGDVQPTAMVDLGRPAFKLGIAELKVGWRAHRLRVAIGAEHEVYHVRDHARVKVAVQTADGTPLPAGAEVAIAAVDEALLELWPNDTWDVLAPMMGKRAYGVSTATAAMQVVGKRHFGQKAKPTGGGGGRQQTRELFDTLLLWRGRVPLDARGRAALDVPLNDSLTSFRLVAIATAGVERFGMGKSSLRSTQDLMVLSGLPPVVRDGDQLRAELTVRNTTDRPLEVTVTPNVSGLPQPLAPVPVSLAPGAAQPVEWNVTVPAGVIALNWEVTAEGPGGTPRDQLKVAQTVLPAVPLTTIQGMLYRAGDEASVPITPPPGALPDQGAVDVRLSPRLGDGLETVKQAMREYPYECLEQQVSRAVTLGEDARWEKIVGVLPSYVDRDGFFKYFPSMREGSEVLTAYVVSISAAAGWTLPKGLRENAANALRQFVDGSLQRGTRVAAADRTIRKLAALEALARLKVLEPALVTSIAVEPASWPTSAVLDWWSILQRVPSIPDAKAKRADVERILRARLNQQGTAIKFTTEDQDGLWWLMTCADGNAARLLLDRVEAGEWTTEVPRLMAGTIARQRRGAWGCTTANAWGRLAADAFSRAYESVPVAGTTTAALAAVSQTQEWDSAPTGKTLQFDWPTAPAALTVQHAGTGVPWVTVRGRAAVPFTEAVAHGYRITRTLTAVERKRPDAWSRGDIARVRLSIAADAEFTWVVVDDPLPAGASHLGTGLGGSTEDSAAGAEARVSPTFVERSFSGLRAYYETLPGGTTTLEYTVRLNQAGTFRLPATHVEAMYDPDVSGDLPNAALVVEP